MDSINRKGKKGLEPSNVVPEKDVGDISSTIQMSELAENVDPLLVVMVHDANMNPDNPYLFMTLQTGGLIVAGRMISCSRFLKKSGERMKPLISEQSEPDKQFVFEWLIEEGIRVAQPEFKSDLPSHIHLEDAQIIANGQPPMPSSDGVLWRGKISSVDAFWFGRLSVK